MAVSNDIIVQSRIKNIICLKQLENVWTNRQKLYI